MFLLLPLFTEKGIMKHAQIRRIHVLPFLIIAVVIHTSIRFSICLNVRYFLAELMGIHILIHLHYILVLIETHRGQFIQ